MYQVSIIVPVYNCENYLSRAVGSLLKQTIPVEIILVDDGSSDKSPEICDRILEKYNNVKVFHVVNGGAAKAREIGIEAATGEYIGFLDSDDWVKPDTYENLYDEAKKLDLDMIQCAFVNIDHYEMSESNFSSLNTEVFDSKTALKSLYGIGGKTVINYLLWNKLTRSSIMKKIPMPLQQKSQNDVPVIPKVLFNCNRIGNNTEAFVYYFHRNQGERNSITDTLWKSKGNVIYSHITAFYDVTMYFKNKNREAYQMSLIHTIAWCLSALVSNETTSECKKYSMSIIKKEDILSCHYLPVKKIIIAEIIKLVPESIIKSIFNF